MGIIGIIIIAVAALYLFNVFAKARVEKQEKERANNHLPATTEKIKNSLMIYFLTKNSKNMTELLKDDITILAETYTIQNNDNATNTFLFIKNDLKHELEESYIYLNTIKVKREITANSITEYMEFYNNDDCLLMITTMSNDRYLKGQHTIIISLLRKF